MKIKIVGGAYKESYRRFNSQTCVNWYPHKAAQVEVMDDDKTMYLKPTPGLTEITEVTGDSVRAVLNFDERLFYVVGNVLYELIGDTATSLGTMTDFVVGRANRVFLLVNGNNQIGIFGGAVAYYYDLATSTLAKVSDADFPGAETAEYMDGYAIVVWQGRVYFSELNDFNNWQGDSVYTPTYEADNTICTLKLKGILWNLGSHTAEPYYNDGTTPFTRTPQASLDIGIYAQYSAAKFADALIFVGSSSRGSLGIYMIDTNHKVDIISPGSIGEKLNVNPEALKSAYAIAEESPDGHKFYHLVAPDLNTCITFDLITNEWHERKSRSITSQADGTFPQLAWRANCLTMHGGDYIVGDYHTGTLFKLDKDSLTEDGIPVTRERVAGIYSQEQKYINVSSLVLDCSLGHSDVTSPKIMFSASTDGGHTYRQERQISLPEDGDYDSRLVITRLGTGRNWSIKLTLTDAVDLAIFGADASGVFGAS
jgi:hypothetical protein